MSFIAVGKIVNVHGIKGLVKVKPYLTHATDLPQFNPLTDKLGRKSFEVSVQGQQGDMLLVAIKGITSREIAEQFKGMELFADRNKLPKTQNREFYYCDLVGMDVFKDNSLFGQVIKVNNLAQAQFWKSKQSVAKFWTFLFPNKLFL